MIDTIRAQRINEFRRLMLLPDPMFCAEFAKKDMFYSDKLRNSTTRAQYKEVVTRARKELKNLIAYSSSSP